MTPGFLGYTWHSTPQRFSDCETYWRAAGAYFGDTVALVIQYKDGQYGVQPLRTGWVEEYRLGPYNTWEEAATVAIALYTV